MVSKKISFLIKSLLLLIYFITVPFKIWYDNKRYHEGGLLCLSQKSIFTYPYY